MEPGLLKSSDWPLLIDLYFFLGGLAGGAFVIATVANLLDAERYRDVVRVGYWVALLAIIPGPLFLIVDLGLPSRFLHMMMVSKSASTIGEGAITLGPFHMKPLSPMNMGAWALLAFGACTFLAALGVARGLVGVIGSAFAFFIAAYPGVLLGATARPLFVNAHWLGAVFLAVGGSTGAAAIALIVSLMGGERREALSRLMRLTAFALIVEVVALALFIFAVRGAGSVGLSKPLGQLLSGPYSLTFWLGAVIVGIVAPLVLQFAGAIKRTTPAMAALVSLLVLVGGFVVKYVIIAAGQAV